MAMTISTSTVPFGSATKPPHKHPKEERRDHSHPEQDGLEICEGLRDAEVHAVLKGLGALAMSGLGPRMRAAMEVMQTPGSAECPDLKST